MAQSTQRLNRRARHQKPQYLRPRRFRRTEVVSYAASSHSVTGNVPVNTAVDATEVAVRTSEFHIIYTAETVTDIAIGVAAGPANIHALAAVTRCTTETRGTPSPRSRDHESHFSESPREIATTWGGNVFDDSPRGHRSSDSERSAVHRHQPSSRRDANVHRHQTLEEPRDSRALRSRDYYYRESAGHSRSRTNDDDDFGRASLRQTMEDLTSTATTFRPPAAELEVHQTARVGPRPQGREV
ncbi:hypothetical protein GN958_ATG15781 [Phytophthora infestans]|uniref:Uncharacterized protein n=1 Tax=Phytophthora infestans TaxID=4787 RepID=A0A8S9U343_PHYIN|nr:hypothetical protein GN958_ATG15781 [Phytophthora infestans]